MDTTKEKQFKLQITISVLILNLILFAEMYLMTNVSEGFLPIIGAALVGLTAVYALINAVINLNDAKAQKIEARFEELNKSEKEMQLMFKKSFDEIADRLSEMEEISEISRQEVINAQKGTSKVIINRNKENADALMNSNVQVIEKLSAIEELQNTQIANLLQELELKLSDVNVQTEMKVQDLIVQLKDAELRLNQAIMSNSKVVMQAPVAYAPVEAVSTSVTEPIVEDVIDPVIEEQPIMEKIVEAIPESVTEDPVPVVEGVVEEKPPMPDLSDPNKMMSPDDIAALLANMGTEDPAPVVEAVVEEKPPMPDLSDPNKMMSPDDIAALLANMGNEDPAPVVEEVVEEKPPMPDLSDPNKMMSPDDIAALLASMGN